MQKRSQLRYPIRDKQHHNPPQVSPKKTKQYDNDVFQEPGWLSTLWGGLTSDKDKTYFDWIQEKRNKKGLPPIYIPRYRKNPNWLYRYMRPR